MIIPIRCFTCGNSLASKYRTYEKIVAKERENQGIKEIQLISEMNIKSIANSENKTPEAVALDTLQLKRYCCRRHLLSQVDIIKYL